MNATPIRYTDETLAPLSPSELYKLYMDIFGIRPKSPNATYLRRQILEGQARLDAERAELAEQLRDAERQVVRGAAGGASEDELGALQAASDERAAALREAGGEPEAVIAQVAVEAGAIPEWAPMDEEQALGRVVRLSDYDGIVVDDPGYDAPASDEDVAAAAQRLEASGARVVIISRVHEDDMAGAAQAEPEDQIADVLGEEQPADLAAQARATVAAFLEARGVKTLGKLSVEALRELYPQAVGRDTGSTDKGYLVWKIREATKGAITLGPVQPRAAAQQAPAEPRPERQPRPPKAEAEKAPHEPSRAAQRRAAGIDRPVLPLAMERPTVDALDAAWRALGFPSRIAFLRVAIAEALERGGQADAAALVRAEAG